MTSRDFCYWLQGYFEINGAIHGNGRSITPEEVRVIRTHLALVFKHEIDPSAGSLEHQAELDKIHTGPPIWQPSPVGDAVYRC